MSEYPHESDLEKIKNWQFSDSKSYYDFANFIISLWKYEDFISLKSRSFQLSTGGWSENEEIMTEIESTIFQMVCWQSSRRGGHYVYELPDPKTFDKANPKTAEVGNE